MILSLVQTAPKWGGCLGQNGHGRGVRERPVLLDTPVNTMCRDIGVTHTQESILIGSLTNNMTPGISQPNQTNCAPHVSIFKP